MKPKLAWLPLIAASICAQDGPTVTGPRTPASGRPVAFVVPPVLTNRVEPTYTPEARAAGLQGTVSLYLEVSADGSPANVQVLHGLGLGLDEKAIEAVKQWQYRAGQVGGSAASAGRSADVNFRLDTGGPWRIRQVNYVPIGPLTDPAAIEVVVKPFVNRYTAPDPAACPAGGGTAVVNLEILRDGVPRLLSPLASGDKLGAAAWKAIESWRFQPGKINGIDRESVGYIEFECGEPSTLDTRAVYRVGNGVTAPVVIQQTEPSYSPEARVAKVEGEMRLTMTVDATGHTVDIQVLTPLGFGLDVKALEALKRWRFKPATNAAGKPVNVQVTIATSYHLK